jgi:hypothetical protein
VQTNVHLAAGILEKALGKADAAKAA